MRTSTYLGDSVYVTYDGFHLILTTGHHSELKANDIIYLEPGLLGSLVAWVKGGHRDYNTGERNSTGEESDRVDTLDHNIRG